jgi:hypothetical protein
MSDDRTMVRTGRLALWLLTILGLLGVGAANWHLVHVARTSQPDCVAHVRLGEAGGKNGPFSAAQSSCSP